MKESVRLKQSLKPKSVNNKNTSVKKQRRISSYFTRSSTTSLTNEQLTEMVIELQRGMKHLHQLIKRKKKRSHGKQSSFHTLLNRSKKPDTPQNTDNPEPSFRNDEPNDQDVLARDTYELPQRQSPIHEAQPEAFPLHDAAPNDQDVGAMETDELPLIQSPIISQYGAQLHRHSTQTLNDHPPIHTPDVHTSNVHNQETDQVSAMETDDTEMNTTNPNSPAWLEVTPKRYNFSSPNTNSAIYDKSEHPNSPPFNHVLLHGVRIYEPLSPDPSSPGPKFDSSLAPSSPLRNPLLLSPEPMTPLTSPKRVMIHCQGQESPSSPKLMVNEEHLGQDGFVDLTHTKDTPRHDKHIENVLQEMRRLIDEQSKLMAAALSASPVDKSNHCTAGTKPQSSVLNIAAAAIALGTMAWLYVKLTT
ncbi:hypothetical protein YC2023_015672 [Brassica napus]